MNNKSIIQWLSAALLVLIVAGLVYLIAGSRPVSWPGQVSPLSARPAAPAAPISPLVEARPTLAAPPAPTLPLPPLELTVLHTNDTWGYLLPCG